VEFREIPGPVRYALPAVWCDEKVVEVPHLRYQSGQGVEKIVENVEFLIQPLLKGHAFWVI